MKLFTGWMISAGLVVGAAAANAQGLAPYGTARPPYAAVSDFEGPYGSYAPRPETTEVPRYGYGPSLLPPQEVYTVLRENGFSPLGIPQLRGLVYTIAVIDRGGNDGRLVIDARTGRIIRFMPAERWGDNFNGDLTGAYGSAGPLPPISPVRGVPRPPAPIPHLASRTVPVPKASPLAAKPAAEPAEQSAAIQPKPADAPRPVPPAAPTTVGQARPAQPAIQPTQEMPKVQGLE
jgi:hypothetical protein